MRKKIFAIGMAGILFCPMVLPAAESQPPKHFMNDPGFINTDPNHVPGDWPLPDPFQAQTLYYQKLAEMASAPSAAAANRLFTLGAGEITFTAVKNESKTVLGYFRNYFGVVELKDDQPVNLQMIVDMNSLDTGVPGRNHRILDLFFQSAKPEWGTATVTFDRFDLGGKSMKKLGDGKPHSLHASGTLGLNGVTRPISAELTLMKQNRTWIADSSSPLSLLISDFGFDDRVYELMKSCNHKSIANAVEIKVKLYFR